MTDDSAAAETPSGDDPAAEAAPRATAEDAGASRAKPERTTRKSGSRQAGPKVENKFRNVNIDKALFGIDSSRVREPAHKGPYTAEDIEVALRCFVEPPTFIDGLNVLLADHAVVIEGMQGLGRQTSALALLRKAAPEAVLYPLRPSLPLDELSKVEFLSGCRYLLADHISTEAGAEADYHWKAVRSKVRDAGAFLVVTRTGMTDYARLVHWERPALRLLLGALLADVPDGDRLAARLGERVPDDWRMPMLVECAERLRKAPDALDHALAVFDSAASDEVTSWFDQRPERRAVVEVTALAFSWGATERRLEQLAADFEQTLEEHLPKPVRPEGEGAPPTSDLEMRRRSRSTDANLIQLKRVTIGTTQRRILVFKSEQHWLRVLDELSNSFEARFWDAVREWLVDMVADFPLDRNGEPDEATLAAVARGLALLAQVDFAEAMAFVEPLSTGAAGSAGISCAAGVLQVMAGNDLTGLAAVRMANHWLTNGNTYQRLAAGEAFIGELGARYQDEAARRLWQLIAQDHELAELAVITPALLFANLVDSGDDAREVLAMVNEKLERFGRPGTALHVVDLTLTMALHLLCVNGERGGQAAFDLIAAHPEAADNVARVFAGVLRNSRYRLRALEAMWDGLHASIDRPAAGALLGDALGRVLPGPRHDAFIRDFTVVDHRKRHRDKARDESISHLIIEALQRLHTAEAAEE
jgi:hypothetical protein